MGSKQESKQVPEMKVREETRRVGRKGRGREMRLSADSSHWMDPGGFQETGTLRMETLRRQKAWGEITELSHKG